MKLVFLALLGASAVMLSTPRVAAHHSFAAQYDATKPVEVNGIVTKVEWTNPHARFYVDATGDKGDVTHWNFEIASPNILVRNGWTRNTLKIGDRITVSGFRGRSSPPEGPQMAIASGVVAADGRKLFASSLNDLGR
jgi:hypothetical protein